MSNRWLACSALLALVLSWGAATAAGESESAKSADAPQLRSLSVEVVDSDGMPVAGVEVGLGACIGERWQDQAAADGTEWFYRNHARTDAQGRAELRNVNSQYIPSLCLVARHEQHKLMAVAVLDPAQRTRIEKLTLLPEVRVTAGVQCRELAERGRSPGGRGVSFDIGRSRALVAFKSDGEFDLALPPGEYSLGAQGDFDKTESITQKVVLKPGEGFHDLGAIDLAAHKLELMRGKPAPVLPSAVAWKNGPPVDIASLRGQVVLLDFWGYWCGSCVNEMPELFAIYDKYRDRGLHIIGVHVDVNESESERVDTPAKLDEQLSDLRGDLWKGHDIPFPVAMLVRDEVTYGARRGANGAYAVYGVCLYPTKVLIDRRGNIAGIIQLNDEGLRLIEQLLNDEQASNPEP